MTTHLSRIAAAAAVAALASMSCRLLSGKPSGSATPQGAGGGQVLFQDDFSSAQGNWQVGENSDSDAEYVDSALQARVKSTDYLAWWDKDSTAFKDVHIEVTVKDQSQDTSHSFGLLCDQQGHGQAAHYWFALDPNGKYEIGKRVVGQDDIVLTGNGDWASSNLIAKNAKSYRLGADCTHGNLAFYVDGQKIDSVQDSTYNDGIVALFLWSSDKPTGPVIFDDVAITSMQ